VRRSGVWDGREGGGRRKGFLKGGKLEEKGGKRRALRTICT